MAGSVVLILPAAAAPTVPLTLVPTPYGAAPAFMADGSVLVLVRQEESDPRAIIYAARESGASRILAGDFCQPVSPLLEPGDLLVPADSIDQTRGRPFTFFAGKGYGFIKLNPPFCPELMAALLAQARERQPRSFGRATYVGIDGPRELSAAEAAMYRQWGADAAGAGLLPEAYLARELELCYAALAVVGSGELYSLLLAAARGPLGGRDCGCGEAMKGAREQGLIGPDWHTWLG